MKREIIHVFDVKADRNTIHRALTTRAGLTGWWTTEVHWDETEKDPIRFRFADVFKPDMDVISMDPGHIEWECTGGAEHWKEGRFIFSLEEKENLMRVVFRQSYAREIDDDNFGRYNFNWAYYLSSLKDYCETGTGNPYGQ